MNSNLQLAAILIGYSIVCSFFMLIVSSWI